MMNETRFPLKIMRKNRFVISDRIFARIVA